MAITPDEISRVQRYEGDKNHQAVNHCYLDTKGNVTIAWGHKIGTAAAAASLPFIHKTDQKPATSQECQTEWTKIKAMVFGQNYSDTYYAASCTLLLKGPDMDALLKQDLTVFEQQLAHLFPGYAQFPQPAKAGLVDMIYTLGLSGLQSSFGNFIAAVKKQDWNTAANECHRLPPVPAARNTEVRQLFLQAVKPKPKPPAPRPRPTPGTGDTGSTGSPIPLHTMDVIKQLPITTAMSGKEQATIADHLSGNYVGLQSIVAIVAISSNVTTAAITAITAIACNKK